MLMVTGAINIAADKKKIAHDLKKWLRKPEKRSHSEGAWVKQSYLIGCAQAAAIIPVFQSGSTVAAGVFQDVPRAASSRSHVYAFHPCDFGRRVS